MGGIVIFISKAYKSEESQNSTKNYSWQGKKLTVTPGKGIDHIQSISSQGRSGMKGASHCSMLVTTEAGRSREDSPSRKRFAHDRIHCLFLTLIYCFSFLAEMLLFRRRSKEVDGRSNNTTTITSCDSALLFFPSFLFAVVDFWQVEKDTKDLRQMIESRFFAPSYARANNST